MYTSLELLGFFLIYSFLGWCIEVFTIAVKDRRFRNRGYLNSPFCLMYGFIMVFVVTVVPTIENSFFKFITIFVIFSVFQTISEFITTRICRRMMWKFEDITPFNGEWMNLLLALIYTCLIWLTFELLHPFVYMLLLLVPETLLTILVISIFVVLALDLLVTSLTMIQKRGWVQSKAQLPRNDIGTKKLNQKIYRSVWRRIEKAYPNMEAEPAVKNKYVFAEGVCLEKIIWIFLTSALLGDLIETVYCRIVAGVWMSRSSVLYGPFSIVWGIGAVLLTLILHKFSDKEDRYIFLVGALVGGVYEYVCSLFTEIFLGTVFWDYSHMMFHIGGRTNLLFMAFWGILSVVWIKIVYPALSRGIEKLPALAGTVLTWGLIAFMICNSLLSAGAMLRYTERQEGIAANNGIEIFLDQAYPDDRVEKVWPNMIIK